MLKGYIDKIIYILPVSRCICLAKYEKTKNKTFNTRGIRVYAPRHMPAEKLCWYKQEPAVI